MEARSSGRAGLVVKRRSGNNRILIVDDNQFAREGMAVYLKRKGYDSEEAGDSATALALARRNSFDAAIIDIVLPHSRGAKSDMAGSEGVRLARMLKVAYPALGVVVFSAFNDRGSEVLALAADGARGLAYMVKGTHPDRVLQAVEDARDGRVVLGNDVLSDGRVLVRELMDNLSEQEAPWVRQAVAHLPELSEREREVADLLAASRMTQGIADTLGISNKTVEKHTNRIYSKLHLTDVDQLELPLRKAVILAKACWLSDLQEAARS
jgi:DNA-binding NarL/FixJ family response regulator